MVKNFFLEIEKSVVLKSRQMVQNLFKVYFLGVAPIFQLATPQTVIANDDARDNSYISVTAGQRVMAYGSKSEEIPCFYLCYEETFLYFQHKKSYSRKTKIATIFGNFFWKIHLRVMV